VIKVKLASGLDYYSAALVLPKPMAAGGRVLARKEKVALSVDPLI